MRLCLPNLPLLSRKRWALGRNERGRTSTKDGVFGWVACRLCAFRVGIEKDKLMIQGKGGWHFSIFFAVFS